MNVHKFLSFCNFFGKKLLQACQNTFDAQSEELLTGKSQEF
jgi:hypothetical protein